MRERRIILEVQDKLCRLQEEVLAAFVSSAALSLRKMAGLGVIAACLVLGHTQRVAAQAGMTGHSMGMQDEVPPDQLPAPLNLSGTGNVHIPITATPEAQTWFNQGLNLFHDFWDYESLRAFEQGVRVDPQCAIQEPAHDDVASLNTHDTPSFAGFWQGKDIEDRLALPLIGICARFRQHEAANTLIGTRVIPLAVLQERIMAGSKLMAQAD